MCVLTVRKCSHFCWMKVVDVTFFFFFCLWPNVFWLGKIEGRRRGGWQRMRWLDSIIDLTDMSLTLGDEF